MMGRLSVAVLVDRFDWRIAVGALGVQTLIGSVVFWWALPREAAHRVERPDLPRLVGTLIGHFRDPGLRLLFAEIALVNGVFVCTYNYLGFRLSAPPFFLSQTAIGFAFVLYLLGIVSSPVMGELAGRYGRRRVLWTGPAVIAVGVFVTLPDNLPGNSQGVVSPECHSVWESGFDMRILGDGGSRL